MAVANYDTIVRRIHPTSSRGPAGPLVKPDLAAPGTRITSSEPPARYGARTGTSMAAPSAAGAVALLISARPDLRRQPAALAAALYGSADPVSPDRCGPAEPAVPNNSAGHGLLRIDHAVAKALVLTATASATPTRPATATPSPTVTEEPPDTWSVHLPRVISG